uniref:Uncharacterized protein n=1 Tax=Ananas comosus var. bracteatus TaxID=296719 RepID=A0A6V7PHN0_ANACO|nr:unnamed protein product [Ananas comosus var. bracteatus]
MLKPISKCDGLINRPLAAVGSKLGLRITSGLIVQGPKPLRKSKNDFRSVFRRNPPTKCGFDSELFRRYLVIICDVAEPFPGQSVGPGGVSVRLRDFRRITAIGLGNRFSWVYSWGPVDVLSQSGDRRDIRTGGYFDPTLVQWVSHGGVWDLLGPIVSMATARGLAWRSLGSSRPYRLHGDRLGSHMAEFGIFWSLSSPWPSPGYELFEGSHITTLDIFDTLSSTWRSLWDLCGQGWDLA